MRPPVLVISDIHFHAYKAHSRLIDGVNSRLLHQMEAWRQAVAIGLERGCELMLIPGDVFEVRGTIKPSVFNRVTALLMETMAKGMNVGIIPGNHDMEHLEAGESAVDSWDYLQVRYDREVRRCKVFKASAVHTFDGHRILGIPYIHDMETFKETYKVLSAATVPDITMIHQGVDSFDTEGSYTPTGLTVEWLEDNNSGIVLCGHYHKPALSRSGRVVNTGALIQHRFTDEGNDRGCWIVDANRVEFVKIDSPEFVTINNPEQLDQNCEGSIVRIRARDAGEAEQLRREAQRAGALSVVVEIEKEFKTAHEKTIRITTPRAMLSEYVDMMDKYTNRKVEIIDLFDRVCF